MNNKIQAKSLVDTVAERLEEAIIGGELAPGDRVFEQVLAAEYGISRGPLREAIRRLEGRRLLERTANKGVRVVMLSPTRIEELLLVRESLEGMAARLAASGISAADVSELRKLLNTHQETSLSKGYYQQSGDFDFHFRIARASRNEFLISLLTEDLYDLLRLYRYKSSTMVGRAEQAMAEHHAIVDALEARDPDAAELAMRTHIANARVHARMALEQAEAEAAPAAE